MKERTALFHPTMRIKVVAPIRYGLENFVRVFTLPHLFESLLQQSGIRHHVSLFQLAALHRKRSTPFQIFDVFLLRGLDPIVSCTQGRTPHTLDPCSMSVSQENHLGTGVGTRRGKRKPFDGAGDSRRGP